MTTKQLADEANMIVNGYTFFKKENGIAVLNLKKEEHAALFSFDDELLESSVWIQLKQQSPKTIY